MKLTIATQNTQLVALYFTIVGDPVGKPRQTQQDKWMKRPAVMRYRAWENMARSQMPRSLRTMQPETIEARAYIRIPNSWSHKKKVAHRGIPHRQKPDADNILKAVCDALFDNDAVIHDKRIRKYWDDGQGPRVEITVT